MTETDFDNRLEGLFQTPSGQVDTARLKANILHTVSREDRRRRLVVLTSSVVGAVITALIVSGSGFVSSAQALSHVLWTWLPAQTAADLNIDLNAPWAAAALGLLLVGLFATRVVRDF